jgi:hypothetical protein
MKWLLERLVRSKQLINTKLPSEAFSYSLSLRKKTKSFGETMQVVMRE